MDHSLFAVPMSPRRSPSNANLSSSARTPHSNDILFGRGGKNSRHIGNHRLREMAKQQKHAYSIASKKEKTRISGAIVAYIREQDPPGRFLKKDSITGQWLEVGDVVAREKICQTLRDVESDDSFPKHSEDIPEIQLSRSKFQPEQRIKSDHGVPSRSYRYASPCPFRLDSPVDTAVIEQKSPEQPGFDIENTVFTSTSSGRPKGSIESSQRSYSGRRRSHSSDYPDIHTSKRLKRELPAQRKEPDRAPSSYSSLYDRHNERPDFRHESNNLSHELNKITPPSTHKRAVSTPPRYRSGNILRIILALDPSRRLLKRDFIAPKRISDYRIKRDNTGKSFSSGEYAAFNPPMNGKRVKVKRIVSTKEYQQDEVSNPHPSYGRVHSPGDDSRSHYPYKMSPISPLPRKTAQASHDAEFDLCLSPLPVVRKRVVSSHNIVPSKLSSDQSAFERSPNPFRVDDQSNFNSISHDAAHELIESLAPSIECDENQSAFNPSPRRTSHDYFSGPPSVLRMTRSDGYRTNNNRFH